MFVLSSPYLAVPSPRSLELDEDGFPGNHFVIVVGGELNGVGNSQKAEKDSNDRLHVGCCTSSVISLLVSML